MTLVFLLGQCGEKLGFAQGLNHFAAAHQGHPLLVTLYKLKRRHIALPGSRRDSTEQRDKEGISSSIPVS
jgi:hypothetical protein